MPWPKNTPPRSRLFPPDEPAPPPARRSSLAITLQLGRARPNLIRLVAAAHAGDHLDMRRAGFAIATAILRGARDRSREPEPRPLHDQQRRSDALTRPRRKPRRPRLATRSDKVAA